MKFLFALLLSFACLACYSQNNNWFKGTWYGIRTFPSAESTIGIPVRLEVSSVRNNNFTAKLIYMFPSDTSARLIIKLQGAIKGTTAQITKSNEIYLQHTLLREIWRECSGCAQKIFYSISGNTVMMKIEHSHCSDSCNGESVFYKRLSEFDSITRVTVMKNLPVADSLPVAKTELAVKNNLPKASAKRNKDSSGIVFKKEMVADSSGKKKLAFTDSIQKKKTGVNDSSDKKKFITDAAPDKKQSVLAIKKITDSSTKKHAVDSTLLISKNTIKPYQKKPFADSLAAIQKVKPLQVINDTIPLAIKQRVTQLITTYQVSSPHINVQLFDNGEIDYDAVSVYYNGKLIINNQTLTHKAITFSLEASATNRHHEFTLIAETEGMIPPNTALMRIIAGSQHFELEVSSSNSRNAKIAIDYTGQ